LPIDNGGAIAYDKVNSRWVIGGVNVNTTYYSDDGGLTWTGVSCPIANMRRLVHDGVGRWVATGSSSGFPPYIVFSTDGALTWTVPTTPFTTVPSALAYDADVDRWHAGVSQNIYYSNDGAVTWTLSPQPVGWPVAWGALATTRIL
jgi:hypothetical protein